MGFDILKISNNKWNDILNNEDIRFLKVKNIPNKITDRDLLIKYSSWDDKHLLNCYKIQKKITKNNNLIKYLCYFEYEDDIIKYLKDHGDQDTSDLSDISDDNNESSIIIRPVYEKILDIRLDESLSDCIKQIILMVYDLLFNYKIYIEIKDIKNIYIDILKTPKKIVYTFQDISYVLYTKYIIKIDISENYYKKIALQNDKHLYILVSANILNILSEFYNYYRHYDGDYKKSLIDIIHEIKKIITPVALNNNQITIS